MSHTTRYPVPEYPGIVINFLHNGDFSGNCTIVVRNNLQADREFTLPCAALLAFAAAYVRQARSNAIEQASDAEVLRGGPR